MLTELVTSVLEVLAAALVMVGLGYGAAVLVGGGLGVATGLVTAGCAAAASSAILQWLDSGDDA